MQGRAIESKEQKRQARKRNGKAKKNKEKR